jgi:hypothetical protein
MKFKEMHPKRYVEAYPNSSQGFKRYLLMGGELYVQPQRQNSERLKTEKRSISPAKYKPFHIRTADY